ncbi:MAG: PEP-utilizing enzyme [Lachnospiraceae bacterium]
MMLKRGLQEEKSFWFVWRLPRGYFRYEGFQGILTVGGGITSHAAVVARGMGACCVSGCGDIIMDEENKKFTLGGKEYHEENVISFDGSTGCVYDGAIPTVEAKIAR